MTCTLMWMIAWNSFVQNKCCINFSVCKRRKSKPKYPALVIGVLNKNWTEKLNMVSYMIFYTLWETSRLKSSSISWDWHFESHVASFLTGYRNSYCILSSEREKIVHIDSMSEIWVWKEFLEAVYSWIHFTLWSKKTGILHNSSGLSIGFESHFSRNVLHMAYNLVLSAHELHESSIIKNVCLSNKWLAEKKFRDKLGSQREDPMIAFRLRLMTDLLFQCGRKLFFCLAS